MDLLVRDRMAGLSWAGDSLSSRWTWAGAPESAKDIYGRLDGDRSAQFAGIIRKNVSLQRAITDKKSVLDLLKRSFDALRQSFSQSTVENLEGVGDYFAEPTTVRRVYLRKLVHTHEHMGQAIAYARSYGVRMPWPDPLKNFESTTAENGTAEVDSTARASKQA